MSDHEAAARCERIDNVTGMPSNFLPSSGEQRGRPRDPSVEDRVLEAAAEELSENGFGGFSIRGVARRSGVSRPSLLLRWPSRDDLIMQTMQRVLEWPTANPDAPFLTELQAIVARIVELMEPKFLGIHLRLVIDAAKYPELFAEYQDKVMTKAATRLTALLSRAVDDGELPEHLDCHWAGDALVGVLFIRSIAARGLQPLPPNAQDRIIETFLNSVRGETNKK